MEKTVITLVPECIIAVIQHRNESIEIIIKIDDKTKSLGFQFIDCDLESFTSHQIEFAGNAFIEFIIIVKKYED
jgi:PP-loop superfamily ATP-utilizing enzyme